MKLLVAFILFLLSVMANAGTDGAWQVDTYNLESSYLKENKLDLNLNREIWVWLPPGYKASNKRYPVIYYIHNYAWSAPQMHEIEKVGETFKRALERGTTKEFIFVVGDFRASKTPGTFCGDNDVVGHWWDHVATELVVSVDTRYRTLASAQSRGVTGDYLGGYCALRIAMERPGVFSSVYAIHPVATGQGDSTMHTIPDWKVLNQAQSYGDLEGISGFTRAFLLMAQSHAPNLKKPPFFADFMMTLDGSELVLQADTITKIRENFLLSNLVPKKVKELNLLNALAFDWGRDDPVRGHVEGNRTFTKILSEYGIAHEAEEHKGNDWSEKWRPYGRVEDRMLPFFNRHLAR